MKRIIVLLFVVLIFSGYHGHASEELTAAKRADIAKLLSITGALNIAKIMANATSQQMISLIQRVRPDIPSSIHEIVRDEVQKTINESMASKGGLIDLMVPIYHQHFTHEEIKGLLSFYGTPLGRKVVEVMPAMAREGMLVGQQWAQMLRPDLERRIKARLSKEGIDL